MSNNETLREFVKRPIIAEAFDVIDIRDVSDRYALLCNKKMPGFGFLVEVNQKEYHRDRNELDIMLIDHEKRGRFYVIGMRDLPHLSDIERIFPLPQSAFYEITSYKLKEEKKEELARRFEVAVITTSLAHNIHTLFVTRNDWWKFHVPGFQIEEGNESRHLLCCAYNKNYVEDALQCAQLSSHYGH